MKTEKEIKEKLEIYKNQNQRKKPMRSKLTVVDKILDLIVPILNDFCNSRAQYVSNNSKEYLAMKIFKIIKDYEVTGE